MTPFDRQVERFRAGLALRTALDHKGNVCAAARQLGVHRNTVTRILRAAGYDGEKLKMLVVVERSRKGPLAAMKKPPANVSVDTAGKRRFA